MGNIFIHEFSWWLYDAENVTWTCGWVSYYTYCGPTSFEPIYSLVADLEVAAVGLHTTFITCPPEDGQMDPLGATSSIVGWGDLTTWAATAQGGVNSSYATMENYPNVYSISPFGVDDGLNKKVALWWVTIINSFDVW